jgi:hypothetical protein
MQVGLDGIDSRIVGLRMLFYSTVCVLLVSIWSDRHG